MEVKFDPEKFRNMIEHSKIPQLALAEKAGTTDRYIRAMSSGERVNPSAAILCSICQVLGQAAEDCMSPDTDTENGDS